MHCLLLHLQNYITTTFLTTFKKYCYFNKVYPCFFFKLPLAIKYMDARQIPMPAAEAIMHDLKIHVRDI